MSGMNVASSPLLSFHFQIQRVALLQEDAGFEKIKSRHEKKKDKLLSMDPTQITYEMVHKKLKEIALSRGKKGIDRQEQVWHLLKYFSQCCGFAVDQGP